MCEQIIKMNIGEKIQDCYKIGYICIWFLLMELVPMIPVYIIYEWRKISILVCIGLTIIWLISIRLLFIALDLFCLLFPPEPLPRLRFHRCEEKTSFIP